MLFLALEIFCKVYIFSASILFANYFYWLEVGAIIRPRMLKIDIRDIVENIGKKILSLGFSVDFVDWYRRNRGN